MRSNEIHTTENSGENMEKITVSPLLYLTALITLAVFLISFIPYTLYGLHLMPIFSFYFSYTFSYLILFFLVFIGLIFYYRHKSVHMEELSQYVTIFGANPRWLVNRTGIRLIDWIGLLAGVTLSVLSILNPKALLFFPGFLLLTLSFLFALLFGSSKKWKLKRRW